MRKPILLTALSLGLLAAGAAPLVAQRGNASARAPAVPAALAAALKAPNRTPTNLARDRYRNPGPTLAFFGVKPTDTVVELWPGGGWYTEILAPYLAARGTYYAAPPARGIENFQKFSPPSRTSTARSRSRPFRCLLRAARRSLRAAPTWC
jgi:predicted methyltransferase